MSIYLNDNTLSLSPKPLDKRYGPYTSVAEALANLSTVVRFRGLTVGVVVDGQLKEYWFANSISDPDLVEKVPIYVPTNLPPNYEFFLPVTEDSEEVVVGNGVYIFRMPFTGLLLDVMASLTFPSSGSPVLVSMVTGDGESILSSPVQIDEGTTSSKNSADPVQIFNSYLPEGTEIRVNVTQVGSSFGGTGLKIYLSLNETGSFCTSSFLNLPVEYPPYGCATEVNTTGVADFSQAWLNCTTITAFPCINTESGTSFSESWRGCSSLVYFPYLNLSNGLDFSYAWQNCSSLTYFPFNLFDNCLATNFTHAWQNCSLSQQSVDNILVSLVAGGQNGGTVDLDGGTSSAPGAAGLAAKATLISRGWTVNHN